MIREIVTINEELCDGCGECIPNCPEGALKLVDGKARLVADRLCDGLGACLGHCPRNAIKIERRDVDAFDEQPVIAQRAAEAAASAQPTASPDVHEPGGGCPGSRLRQFQRPAEASGAPGGSRRETAPTRSELTHWPIQLTLLPPHAPVLRGAKLLVAADCVPFAYADFHQRLLRGRAVVVGCPKLDDLEAYVERLTEIVQANDLQEIVVARMIVPCCRGIVLAVREAARRAGVQLPITEVVIGVEGELLAEHTVPPRLTQEPAA